MEKLGVFVLTSSMVFAQLNPGTPTDIHMYSIGGGGGLSGWVVDSSGITLDGSSSFYNFATTSIKDTLVCGIGVTQYSSKGVDSLSFKLCHIYDWNKKKTLSIRAAQGTISSYTMCSSGKFVSAISVKIDTSSDTLDD